MHRREYCLSIVCFMALLPVTPCVHCGTPQEATKGKKSVEGNREEGKERRWNRGGNDRTPCFFGISRNLCIQQRRIILSLLLFPSFSLSFPPFPLGLLLPSLELIQRLYNFYATFALAAVSCSYFSIVSWKNETK